MTDSSVIKKCEIVLNVSVVFVAVFLAMAFWMYFLTNGGNVSSHPYIEQNPCPYMVRVPVDISMDEKSVIFWMNQWMCAIHGNNWLNVAFHYWEYLQPMVDTRNDHMCKCIKELPLNRVIYLVDYVGIDINTICGEQSTNVPQTDPVLKYLADYWTCPPEPEPEPECSSFLCLPRPSNSIYIDMVRLGTPS